VKEILPGGKALKNCAVGSREKSHRAGLLRFLSVWFLIFSGVFIPPPNTLASTRTVPAEPGATPLVAPIVSLPVLPGNVLSTPPMELFPAPGLADEATLNSIVQKFRGRLRLRQPVSVSIVEANKHLVSVEESLPGGKSFIVKFDKHFLPTLAEGEIPAVIAHELGHVWCVTHQPYLQTEPMANEKAMQLVNRESLEKVYEKVWEFQGRKGTLQDLLAKVE